MVTMTDPTADEVERWHIEPKDTPGRAHLVLRCDHSKSGECRFPLWMHSAAGVTWQWDGSIDRPTITPSIQCNNGCGRHFTMIAGEMK